jgi:hypothetical protein
MRHSLVLSVVLLASCTPPPATDTTPAKKPGGLPSGLELGRDPDLAGPEGVVLTFIEAASGKDVDALGTCFSSRSDKEFQAILEGKVTPDDLSQIADMFTGASIVKTTMGPEGVTAVVKVKLEWEGREFEEIKVHAEGSAWKITGF